MSDFEIQDEGSLIILHPLTEDGQTWADEHLPEDTQTFGNGLVIERRHFADIYEGILRDGLVIG